MIVLNRRIEIAVVVSIEVNDILTEIINRRIEKLKNKKRIEHMLFRSFPQLICIVINQIPEGWNASSSVA